MHRSVFPLTSVALLLGFLTGCTTTHGSSYVRDQWTPTNRPLGRVAILRPRLPADATSATRDEVYGVVRDTLSALPGTSVADPGPLMQALGNPPGDYPVSDYEAVVAARNLGFETVCLLTVGAYQGYFGMSLPPVAWKSETTVTYSIHLVDVASGKLLLDAVKSRSTGGVYAVRTAGDLVDELSTDLRDLFSSVSMSDRGSP